MRIVHEIHIVHILLYIISYLSKQNKKQKSITYWLAKFFQDRNYSTIFF